MTIDRVRSLHSARPFRPFEIYLADSRVLVVNHPAQLAVSPTGRSVQVAHANDTVETIDLLLVVSLKPRPNRRPRRRA